eukprot:2499261-Pyramimonas_sp.AAC.1
MRDPTQPEGPAGPASAGDAVIKSEPMEVDMEAVSTAPSELEARHAAAPLPMSPKAPPMPRPSPLRKRPRQSPLRAAKTLRSQLLKSKLQ